MLLIVLSDITPNRVPTTLPTPPESSVPPIIEEAIANAVRAVKEMLKSDFDRAMNKYN